MASPRRICFVLFLLLAFVLSSQAFAGQDAEKKTTEENVALVNGVPISQAELVRTMTALQMEYKRRNQRIGPEDISSFRDKVLDNLIGKELLYQEARKENITVDKNEIKQRLDMLKSRFPSEVEFERMLEKKDLTEADVLLRMEKEAMRQKLFKEKFAAKAAPTDAQLKEFYEKNKSMFVEPASVRASHILIKVEPDASQEDKVKAKKEIQDIADKIGKGESFEELAKEHSACPSSAKGGDLGFFMKGQMVPQFEEVAFSMKPGEVSDVVETQFGYHVIKLTDKKPEKQVDYNEVKDRLKSHLTANNTNEMIGDYINELRKNADIKNLMPKN